MYYEIMGADIRKLQEDYPEIFGQKMDRFVAKYFPKLENLVEMHRFEDENTSILAHGDLYSNNILFSRQNGPEVAGIIDFQVKSTELRYATMHTMAEQCKLITHSSWYFRNLRDTRTKGALTPPYRDYDRVTE